jgi:hypothetical protein
VFAALGADPVRTTLAQAPGTWCVGDRTWDGHVLAIGPLKAPQLSKDDVLHAFKHIVASTNARRGAYADKIWAKPPGREHGNGENVRAEFNHIILVDPRCGSIS